MKIEGPIQPRQSGFCKQQNAGVSLTEHNVIGHRERYNYRQLRMKKSPVHRTGLLLICLQQRSDYLTVATVLLGSGAEYCGRTMCRFVDGAAGAGTCVGFGVPMRSSFGESSGSRSLNNENQHLTPDRIPRFLLDIEILRFWATNRSARFFWVPITTSCVYYDVAGSHRGPISISESIDACVSFLGSSI